MPELPEPVTVPVPASLRAGQGPLPASLRAGQRPLSERLRETPGLAVLVAEAEATWRDRAATDGQDAEGPGWRAFEDAFPTFYEFTNRPR